MKRIFGVLGVIALLSTGCSHTETDTEDSLPTQRVYATLESPSGSDTKVYADEELKVLWNEEDLISYFNKLTLNEKWMFMGETGDNAGYFDSVSSPVGTGNDLAYYCAVYPYATTTKISNQNVMTVTLPAQQAYAKDSFGIGANTMVAVSASSIFSFKNVGGYLSFKLYGEGISVSSITLKGNNGELLAGKGTIPLSVGSVPVITMSDSATKEITLSCETPVPLNATSSDYVEFWLVVPPTVFTKGFAVTIVDSNGGICTRSISSKFEITRSNISRMAPLKVVTTIPVTGVEINHSELTLPLGSTETLTATVLPENATNKTVTWSSSDESVATVDESGKVTALKVGSTTITAKAGEKTATCAITVIPVAVTGVTLDKEALSLKPGETSALTATVLPEDAADKSVTWSSSDTGVATVDANGKVTAKSVGTATVTVTTTDGGKQATCVVNVSPIAVTSISLNKTTLSLVNGTSETLTATVTPENATDKTVTWTNSNTSVASVSNGTVTAKEVGTTKITATAGGKSATCTVTVTPILVSGITLNATTASIYVGGTITLTPNVTPANAADKAVTWSSSDKEVATVNTNGVVSGVKAGTATITATAHDGSGVKASCTVTVSNVAVTSVSLSKTTLSLVNGTSETLTATVLPENATNKTVTWTSSSTSVASVSNGTVTAKGVGTAKITATAGGKSATCTVTVTPIKVSSITLNKTSLSIRVGSSTTLSPNVLPTNAADNTVTWSSSNSSVATVSNGEVTGVKAGTATITATANDGSGVTAECSVTVVGLSSIAIYSESLGQAVTSIDLYPYETHDLGILCRYSDGTSDVVSGSVGYWQIGSDNVATCTFGLITAVKRGSSTSVTVGYQSRTASCTINVLDPAPSEAIDLGLSVKWGNRNLGAASITADGQYYSTSDILKYNNSTGLDVSMRLSDGEYRTPTRTEMQELIDGCNVTQTTIDGVTGALFTSKKNGNSVFFPNTGMYMIGYESSPDIYYPTPEIEPCYWTSTPYNYTNASLYRIRWYINPGSFSQVSGPYIPFIDVGGKQYRYPIRPVYNK